MVKFEKGSFFFLFFLRSLRRKTIRKVYHGKYYLFQLNATKVSLIANTTNENQKDLFN